MSKIVRKIFSHGGSYAIDLPMSFVKKNGAKEFILEAKNNTLIVQPNTELDTMEDEPQFAEFIQAIAAEAMNHPEKLKNAKEVWDEEWDELLKGVTADDE